MAELKHSHPGPVKAPFTARRGSSEINHPAGGLRQQCLPPRRRESR